MGLTTAQWAWWLIENTTVVVGTILVFTWSVEAARDQTAEKPSWGGLANNLLFIAFLVSVVCQDGWSEYAIRANVRYHFGLVYNVLMGNVVYLYAFVAQRRRAA